MKTDLKSPLEKSKLWLTIKNYRFEKNCFPWLKEIFFKETLVGPLCKEYGWDIDFARRAVNEYKKYLYIRSIGNYVPPSLLIDKVWRKHLSLGDTYKEYCEKVIQFQLEYSKELVPQDEKATRFSEEYKNTLALYETEFGFTPVENIWGAQSHSSNLFTEPTDAPLCVLLGKRPKPNYFPSYPTKNRSSSGNSSNGGCYDVVSINDFL